MMQDNIILFGDSLTAGYYQSEITDLLTRPLSAAFKNYSVRNAGIPGETTEDALSRLESHVVSYQPKIVTLFFGANDIVPGQGIPLERFKANLEKMIKKIGREKVILVGLPLVNQRLHQDTHSLKRLDLYSQHVEGLSQKYQTPYIDLLSAMQSVAEPTVLWQRDGVHFSKEGYEFLAQLFIETISKKIKQLEGGRK